MQACGLVRVRIAWFTRGVSAQQVTLYPYKPLLTTGWQVSLAGALAPKTQLGVVNHDGAGYLKAPTTDAGTGPDSFTRRFQKLQRTHLKHQSIAELSYTRAAVAAAVEAAEVAAAKTAREAAMKTAPRAALPLRP